MARVGYRISGFALATLAIFALWAWVAGSPALAAASCDLVASPSGNDASPGTAAQPLRSAQAVVDSLGNGQTGCLRNGTYTSDDSLEVTRPGVNLTSYPGERAKLVGLVKVAQAGSGATISNLDIDGRGQYSMGPMIYGSNVTFDNVDVTNHNTGICFIVGAVDPSYGRPSNTVIENSRIHDCGVLPSENGDHGIYVNRADGTVIRNNWIYDNADRGIQLYPDSQGARVYGNVIDGNGEGVIFSGSEETASSNNIVENNVISNSKIRHNIEEFWSDGAPVGTGNVARNNCVWSSNPDDYYNGDGGILGDPQGFAAYGNVIANPRFINRAADNFNLKPGSPCGPGGLPVTLSAGRKSVHAGGKVVLSGRVKTDASSAIRIQARIKGRWHKFTRAPLRANGKFKVRTRLGRKHASKRLRLRAWVPRVGRSKPITIKVR